MSIFFSFTFVPVCPGIPLAPSEPGRPYATEINKSIIITQASARTQWFWTKGKLTLLPGFPGGPADPSGPRGP